MVSAIGHLILGEGHRRPDVGAGGRVGETGRHHAYYGVLLAVECDGLPHQAWVARKAALPQSVADQDDVRPAWPVFFGQEYAAQRGLRAEHREQVLSDGRALQFLRLAGVCARVSR